MNEGNGGFFGGRNGLRSLIGVCTNTGTFTSNLILVELLMSTIAIRSIGRMFAHAEKGYAIFFGNKLFWCDVRYLMTAIAEWLIT